jgi:hypothetical protein
MVHVEPLVDIFDLLLALGFIALGICGLAVVITVEIYYFRKGGKKHGKTVQAASHQACGVRLHKRNPRQRVTAYPWHRIPKAECAFALDK